MSDTPEQLDGLEITRFEVSSEAPNVASVEPAILREGKRTRLSVHAKFTKRPDTDERGFKVRIEYAKRKTEQGWDELDDIDLRTVKAGERLSLQLNSAETRHLLGAISRFREIERVAGNDSKEVFVAAHDSFGGMFDLPDPWEIRWSNGTPDPSTLSKLAGAIVTSGSEDGGDIAALLDAVIAEGDVGTLKRFVETSVTEEDIVAVEYRKQQLAAMERLITDTAEFDAAVDGTAGRSPERVWQEFFERNRWVFGHGLSRLWLSGIDDARKLEQSVVGSNFIQPGKRSDALLRTRGLISSLCFAEIKHHRTQLLSSREYRSGVWAPSKELVGAVAQVQATAHDAVASLQQQVALTDRNGNKTGELVQTIMPRCFVVIGSNEEFISEHGTNESKVRSFELYRRSITNPEILTFDELLERTRQIVQSSDRAHAQSDPGK